MIMAECCDATALCWAPDQLCVALLKCPSSLPPLLGAMLQAKHSLSHQLLVRHTVLAACCSLDVSILPQIVLSRGLGVHTTATALLPHRPLMH